ncbi:MAG: hypothetical protein KDC83_02380 [Flavobacteriales bacterium]|nr:hypothetical protein [Flavobacteriales bacterium]
MIKRLFTIAAAGLLSFGLVAQDNPAFKNGFTLKFGLVPGGKNFGDLSELNSLNTQDYTTAYAKLLQDVAAGNPITSVPLEPTLLVNQEASFGYGFELGTMFFLNSVDFHDQIRLGIDVTWFEMYYSSMTYDTYKPGGYGRTGVTKYGEPLKAHSIRPGAKVGVSVSYSPVEKLAIDLSFRVNPMLNVMAIIPGTVYEESFPTTNWQNGSPATGTFKEDVGAAQVGFGMRFVPGLYVRYAPFFVGIDMPMGSPKYNGGLATAVTLEDPSSPLSISIEPSAEIHKYKSKTNEFRILLGFKF